MDLMDPTAAPEESAEVRLAPRPKQLQGLRVGLIDNTKVNSKALLLKVARRLEQRHGMTVTVMNRKRSPSHEVDPDALAQFKTQVDFAVSGVGD